MKHALLTVVFLYPHLLHAQGFLRNDNNPALWWGKNDNLHVVNHYISVDSFPTIEPKSGIGLSINSDTEVRINRSGAPIWFFADDAGGTGRTYIGVYPTVPFATGIKARLEVSTPSDMRALGIKPHASQTARLIESYDSTGAILKAYWDKDGFFGTRKLAILDVGGVLNTFWDFQVAAGTASYLQIRDNNANDMLWLNSATSGSSDKYGKLMGDWRPSTTVTYDLGSAALRWRNARLENFEIDTSIHPTVNGGGSLGVSSFRFTNTFTNYLTLSGVDGTGGVVSNLIPSGSNAWDIGSSAYRWKKLWLYDVDILGTCTGCSGLPAVDTTAIVKGSVDGTKLLRLEVDGFTTATTRVLTPQNADYTLAGLETSQTFTNANVFQASSDVLPIKIRNFLDSQTSRLIETYNSAGALIKFYTDRDGHTGVRKLNILDVGGTLTTFWDFQAAAGTASYLQIRDNSGNDILWLNSATGGGSDKYGKLMGDWRPSTTTTYDIGTTTLRWRNARFQHFEVDTEIFPVVTGTSSLGKAPNRFQNTFTNYLTLSGTGGSGGVVSNLNPSGDNAWDIGDPSYRWKNLYIAGLFSAGELDSYQSSSYSNNADADADVTYVATAYSSSAASIRGGFNMERARGTRASPSTVVAGDRLGVIGGRGYVTDGFTTSTRINIVSDYVDGAGSNRIVAARMDFATMNTAGVLADRWTLQNNGAWTPSTDNSYTLGTSSLRPINAYLRTTDVLGNLTTTGAVYPTVANTYDLGISGTNYWRFIYANSAVLTGGISMNGTITGASNMVDTGSTQTISGQKTFSAANNYLANSTAFGLCASGSGTCAIGSTSARPNVYAYNLSLGSQLTASSGSSIVFVSSGFLQFTGSNQLVAANGANGVDATLSCGAGQAVKSITVSGGVVTSVSCGAP